MARVPVATPPFSSQTPAGLEEKRFKGGRPARRWGRWQGGLGAQAAVEAVGLGRGWGTMARDRHRRRTSSELATVAGGGGSGEGGGRHER